MKTCNHEEPSMPESTYFRNDSNSMPELHIQDIFNNAPIGVFISTPEGRIISANAALVRMFGYESPEELMASITDIATQMYADPADRGEFMRLLEHGEVFNHECRFRRQDGTGFWGSMNVRAIRDENGRIVAYQGLNADITEQKKTNEKLKRIEWMLSGKPMSNIEIRTETHDQGYGDLTQLNRDGIILKSIGRERLESFANDYLNLLGTSSAIYEVNGDYAFGIFSSGWCRMLDSASRRLCNTSDNTEALNSGRWLCHESCWTDCSKRAIAECAPVDIACNGGLRIYAVPILAHGNVVGAINFGYGDPPNDSKTRQKLAEAYHLDYDDLVRKANAYDSRPPFIIELAKKRLHATARLIGAMIETKQAEEALRESEKKLRATLDATPFPIAVVDLQDDKIFFWSRSALELFGHIAHTASEWYQMAYPDPDYRQNVIERWKPCLEKARNSGQTVDTGEYRVTCKDGSERICELYATLLPDNLIVTFNDITERKQAEEKLKEKKQLLQVISDNMFDLVSLTDLEGKFIFVGASHNILGYDIDSLIGRNILEFVHPEDLPKIQASFRDFLSEFDDGQRVEYRYRCADASYLWFETVGKFIRDDNGDSKEILFSTRDVTERKRIEQELKESEERFRALHNASFGGIAIHDKGLILECNQGLSEITGYAYDELIGMDGLSLISDGTRNKVVRNINAGYEKPYEAEGVRKDGGIYPLRLEARNIRYKGKDVRVVEFRDISENKRAEKEKENLEVQLHQAQKMESVGRLAGGVAHDFNNMLGVILGHTEMALEQMDPAQHLFADLQEVRKAAERSADLTRQLLTFARKQTIAPRVIDINETVEGMLKMLRRLIGEDIDLAWLPGKNLTPVKVDPSQIDHILANLCVNARDAIMDVGKITIETDVAAFDEAYCADHAGFVPGEHVLLAVSDNGSGMDPETVSHLFEPFFTTKEQGKGTGLGLASVYGAVKQNNGFINVYSEPGQGTTFKIYLPRHEAKTPVRADTATAKPAACGNETILLVEDEPAILRMATMMLERLGYAVIAAITPGEAIRLAHEHRGPIDLLMTDVVMPEMNGRDLAKNLLSTYPGIKRLFMSGYTANVIAHHGVLDQGVYFIQKPFSSKDLGVKLREVLEDKNAD